jgi:hypothetical protein
MPFIPYGIKLLTGESIRVTHPEAAILNGRLVICRESARVYRVFDSSSVCELHDIRPAAAGA